MSIKQPTQSARPENSPIPSKADVANSHPDEEDSEVEESSNKFLFFNVMPSWMVSFVTHIALIVVLAIWFLPSPKDKTVNLVAAENATEEIDQIDINLTDMQFDEVDPLDSEVQEEVEEVVIEEPVAVEVEELFETGDVFFEESSFEEGVSISQSDSSSETNARADGNRERLLKKYGGSAASEEAVGLALKWIAAHQLPDGGWNLDHRIGPGNHRTSPDPGDLADARNAATALALLPFLGNGQTHLQGKYKTQVQQGLEFLMSRAQRKGRGISYFEPGGSMYSHGLVSIVFCEAFAMTKDTRLLPYAQGTVWFIEDAQDPVGGGWRYRPGQAGDTSAVGWQLMALKSGRITGLDINKRTYNLAEKFLDSVSINSGAFYGYDIAPREGSKGGPARNACGLLCRMYMGWDKNSPGLVDGVDYLDDRGPDTTPKANMYYNYYATQVMKHWGGDMWKKWNARMRDFLVKSQSKKGVTEGSWFYNPTNHAQEKGGRLYVTAMCCMTLEVYYRYLPLYSEEAADDDFVLD